MDFFFFSFFFFVLVRKCQIVESTFSILGRAVGIWQDMSVALPVMHLSSCFALARNSSAKCLWSCICIETEWESCNSGIELFKVGTAKLSVDSRNIQLHFLTRVNGQKRTMVLIRLSVMV